MTRFLSIGECMVEMSRQADGRYAMGFAGDTFNTAWYAARLGLADLEVAYMSAIGDDEASGQMARFINASGIVPELRVRPGMNVGLYTISLDNGERSFSYWRSTSAARTMCDDLEDLPDLRAGDMAYFSGITLAILTAKGRQRFFPAVRRARKKGVIIAFDPNLRPRLWDSQAQMCAVVMQGAEAADIVLPSHEDEATFFGDADPEATAMRYLAAGARQVVTKNGPDPVLVAEAGLRLNIPTRPAEHVVDTTAAGDSFNAQYLAAILTGEGQDAAARKACALSRQVITAPGALVEVMLDAA